MLAIPHPTTILLEPVVLVSFAFFQVACTFSHVSTCGVVVKKNQSLWYFTGTSIQNLSYSSTHLMSCIPGIGSTVGCIQTSQSVSALVFSNVSFFWGALQ